MPFEYADDGVTSDLTVHVWAKTLEELLNAAGDATTGVMVASLDSVRPVETRPLSVEAEEADLLLVRYLGEILFHKDAASLLLRPTDTRIDAVAGRLRARALLRGETIDARRHVLGADVKAVTVHGLRVARTGDGWDAAFTLDV